MKVSKQITIDKIIVKPLVIILNVLVKVTGKILRLNHDLDKPFNTIGVCKYKGMGSIIQATPLLQTLRDQYPQATIVFISTKQNSNILSLLPMIDKIVTLDDSSAFRLITSLPGFILRLIRFRFGVFLDLEIYAHFSSLVTTLSMARNRIGFYIRSGNYRLGTYTHMMFLNNRVPIHQNYLQMARFLGCRNVTERLFEFPGIPAPQPDDNTKPYFIINPNCSDLREERRWAMVNYQQLIHRLLDKFTSHQIRLIGSKAEMSYVARLVSGIQNPRLIDISGKTSVPELISTIKGADLVITNDTGPMHLSIAVDTRTVALFGPADPGQYFLTSNTYIIFKGVFCSPCVHEFEIPPCNGDNQCMKQITVDEVLEAINKIEGGSLQPGDERRFEYWSVNEAKGALGSVRRGRRGPVS